MELRPARIEDVPVPELSGLTLIVGGPSPELVAIGDCTSVLVRAVLREEPLEWSCLEVSAQRDGVTQFEGVAVAGDGTVLVLREDPPTVSVVDRSGTLSDTVSLNPGHGKGLHDVFQDRTSSGEGLVPLSGGRLLVAQEKHPPLLVEFGQDRAEPAGVTPGVFAGPGRPWERSGDGLHALAAWTVEGLDDISDLELAGDVLYCLSDQSCRIAAVELPLDPESRRVHVAERWDLRVPGRSGPEGKPEGLAVAPDGTFIVGLDTKTPEANLCWFPR